MVILRGVMLAQKIRDSAERSMSIAQEVREFELVRIKCVDYDTMAAVPPLSSRRACRAELSFGRKLLAAASPRIHSRCTSGEEELLSGRGRAEKASRRRSASRFWSLVHSETFGRCQGLARACVRRVAV